MEVLLVRHACAGRKGEWPGPDDDRPLDPSGHRQAEALVDLLAERPPAQLLSSSSRRCVETLEPLARRLALPIQTVDELRVGCPPARVLRFVTDVRRAGALLCTHGEVQRDLLPFLTAHRATIFTERDEEDWLLGKGTVWALRVEGGKVRRLTHLAPLPGAECEQHVLVPARQRGAGRAVKASVRAEPS